MKIDPKLDLVLERIVDVSPELVWMAWTQRCWLSDGGIASNFPIHSWMDNRQARVPGYRDRIVRISAGDGEGELLEQDLELLAQQPKGTTHQTPGENRNITSGGEASRSAPRPTLELRASPKI